MPRIEDSVVINRPIEEVWAYLTDFFNAPRLSGSGIIGLRQTSPGPLGVGSTLQARRVVLGFETRNNFQVTEWDPPRAFAATTASMPFRSSLTRLALEATADGTLFHMVTDFQLQPVLRLIWPIMGPVVRRRIRASFVQGKALIEGRSQ
jgi:Polyketide cyclase / dehydrase and lipid transport